MRKITFNKYSGLRIKGRIPLEMKAKDPLVISKSHIEMAFYITAVIESGGVFGTVINYDGTGMTAGIHQAIAVYPKNLKAQGPLWKLLSRMYVLPETPLSLINIREELHDFGLDLTADGVVRNESGNPVSGTVLRKFFGTPQGKLGKGEDRARAEQVIQLFHGLFSDERTHGLQVASGTEHFLKIAERTKLRFSKAPRTKCSNIQQQIYGPLTDKHFSMLRTEDMSPELNLAMCLYWSYLVNAPGMALKKMCKTLDAIDRRTTGWGDKFSRLLVRNLGTSSYGRWDDDIDSGRYQRTRRVMMMGLFDAALFRKGAIMPKDFPGA